jgi:hypothetical protein
MKKTVIVAAMAALVAGCQSKPSAEMSYSELKQYAGSLVERCRKQVSSESEMQACINQEARSDEYKRRQAVETRKAIGRAIASGSQAYGRSLQANRPVNCTSTGYGNTVRTTCY